jgi:DNA-binding protein H-NS
MSRKSPAPKLEGMSLEDLIALKDEVEKQIKKAQKSEKRAILKQMNEMARKAGFLSASDVIDGLGGDKKPRSDKGVKHPPKFQNPNDPAKTWSGQGRAPGWILEYEKKKGKSRDDLLIK